VSAETARLYAIVQAELRATGRPIPSNDLWIAAAARELSLPLLSRDKHFADVNGIEVVSWSVGKTP
jgi:tRNA(fMet)-specific endonuclease VapC